MRLRYLDTGPHWHGHWHEIEGGALAHGHEHEHEQLVIYLGDDRADGDYHGRTPLAYVKDDGTVPYKDELNNMYLGNLPSTEAEYGVDVTLGTILHEFGHVIDRREGYTESLYEFVPNEETGSDYHRQSRAIGEKAGLILDMQIPKYGVQGFGAKEALYNELGIAPFVTDVVEVSGETLHIYSVQPESFGKFETLGGEFYNCSARGGCGPREIDWRRVSKEPDAKMTNNAIALRNAFRKVLEGILDQLLEDDMHE